MLHVITERDPDVYLEGLRSRARSVGGRPWLSKLDVVLETLTHRERELLSYFPSHLSQHEIAQTMYVSLNTVKTHAKAVYRKLGVASRSQAVKVAHSHGLI